MSFLLPAHPPICPSRSTAWCYRYVPSASLPLLYVRPGPLRDAAYTLPRLPGLSSLTSFTLLCRISLKPIYVFLYWHVHLFLQYSLKLSTIIQNLSIVCGNADFRACFCLECQYCCFHSNGQCPFLWSIVYRLCISHSTGVGGSLI